MHDPVMIYGAVALFFASGMTGMFAIATIWDDSLTGFATYPVVFASGLLFLCGLILLWHPQVGMVTA